MSVERKDLIKAAKELNDVLGLDPQIKTGKKVTDKELIDQLLEAADLLLPEDDISEETMRVIKLLEGESVEDEEDEEIEEEEMEEDDAEDVDVEDEDEFDEEEEEPKPAPEKEKKEQKEQKPKAKKTPPVQTTLTRVAAAALAIKNSKKPLTIEELVKAADEMYVKEGGKSNFNESRSNVTKALQALIAFGVVEEKDGVVRVK
jgi:outer membrane biosynthesis protein TonB